VVEVESNPEPIVGRGSVLVYRTFDAADAIQLQRAEQLLLTARVERTSLTFRTPPAREIGALKVSAAPLRVDLGMRELTVGGTSQPAHATIQIFDYGTFSVLFELPVVKPTPLEELARTCIDLCSSSVLSGLARKEHDELCAKMKDAISGAHLRGEISTYGMILVRRLEQGGPRELLEWNGLAKLVAGESDARPASSFQSREVLDYADGYLADDLVVVGTHVALIVEPSGSHEVAEVIEVARAQAAQLRHADNQLDDELARACQDFDRHRLALAVWSPHGPAVRRLSRRIVELTEFSERIDNALRVVSDEYLSRVYRKAVRRFAMPTLKERVAHKQRLVAEIYSVLRDEVQMVRSFVLEIAIVLLIVTEIAMALLVH
jgi:hypothetical protein